MPHKTLLLFIFPSAFAMFLVIFMPIISVIAQSMFIEHEQVLIEVENCGPFGCTTKVTTNTAAMAALNERRPLGVSTGLAPTPIAAI